ncbi:MAG TPA: HEAT repeat domain-containing protein [Phycisphaerae bacterium]|nr:HEAT repeat domain-containing protein [Phycisphaerae bacterium]
MFVAIAIMVVVWLVVILCRHQIRARWWTYKLTTAETLDEQGAWLARLVALGHSGVPSARRLMAEDDPLLRSFGLAILEHAPGADAGQLLVTASTDTDPSIRTEAVRGLGARRDLEALTRIARRAEPVAASAAAVELGRMGGDEGVDLLIQLLRTHESVRVRVQAIECLGQLPGPPDARRIDALTQCLDDDTVFEGHTAAERAAMDAIASLDPAQPVDWPPSRRTVGQIAARALKHLTDGLPDGTPATQEPGFAADRSSRDSTGK